MARKITVQDLIAEGVEPKEAQRIVDKLNAPKPKVITWQFKATPEQLAQVAKTFPNMKFEKRYKSRQAPAKKS